MFVYKISTVRNTEYNNVLHLAEATFLLTYRVLYALMYLR